MSRKAPQRSSCTQRAVLCLALGLLVCALLAGCGTTHGPVYVRKSVAAHHRRHQSHVVDIYSSLPFEGPLRDTGIAVRAGIRMALEIAHHRAGEFRVSYHSLDDASLGAHGVDLRQTAVHASKVAADADAMFYIGDLTSAATEVSLPMLNPARIPQITPASTYIGLTQAVHGVTASGEPQIYHPGAYTTLFRLMPNDLVQARVAVLTLHERNCQRVSAVGQGKVGAGVVTMMASAAKTASVDLVPYTRLVDKPAGITTYIDSLHTLAPECFVIAAQASKVAVALTQAIHKTYPIGVILGSASLCNRRWTDPAAGGAPETVDGELYCVNPLLKLDAYPGGSRFAALYARHHGGAIPSPWALYGYEAAQLALNTIERLGPLGNDRVSALAALADELHKSYLGAYAFSSNGDTDLQYYGLYRVVHGVPVYYHKLDLAKTP